MGGLDSKEWKSVVLPKIYEEKMQKLEAELEKKVRILCLVINNVTTYFRDTKMISCKKIGSECCLFC